MKVVLDIRSGAREAEASDNEREARRFRNIVAVTLECLVVNLSQEYPQIRLLDLKIDGPKVYHAMEGVYPIEAPSENAR